MLNGQLQLSLQIAMQIATLHRSNSGASLGEQPRSPTIPQPLADAMTSPIGDNWAKAINHPDSVGSDSDSGSIP
ncbi:MAG: hypothetical protein EA001_11440 [Oscillatoriales cyanobacterium]|nr:MAG: hypothetical protein EA001_11440 [Oscillatoriales cyanobacterium]